MANGGCGAIEEFFSNITIGMKPHPLQFEDGNVIIRLGDLAEDHLVLHEEVLKASERFRVRFRSGFYGGREVADTKSGKQVTVFEYHLKAADGTFTLTDEGDKGIEMGKERTVYTGCFHLSDLVEGYLVTQDVEMYGAPHKDYNKHHAEIVMAHKMLFSLLYCQVFDIGDGVSKATYTLTEVTALAEYYLFLPMVAIRITTLLEFVPGIWKHIAETPISYLALATKLRASGIFADALRHYVGRSLRYPTRHYDPNIEVLRLVPELAFVVLDKYLQLKTRMDTLVKELRGLGLTWYQAHASTPTKRQQGPKVRTTWLASAFERKTFADKCRWVAASIYREWLDHKMHSEPHWSHVEYAKARSRAGDVKAGDVKAGSLRVTCNAILEANESPNGVDIFGHNAARKFAAIFKMFDDPQSNPIAMIDGQLKALLRNAAKSIRHWFPLEPHGINGDDDYSYAYAQHDAELDYFTYVGFKPEYDVPWANEGGWEAFNCETETTLASNDWQDVLGLIKQAKKSR